jgi:hypothetical protein
VSSATGLDVDDVEGTPMQIQAYLRHAMAEVISEGIINCLIVTNSSEANIQLTRIHEHIFAREFFSFGDHDHFDSMKFLSTY